MLEKVYINAFNDEITKEAKINPVVTGHLKDALKYGKQYLAAKGAAVGSKAVNLLTKVTGPLASKAAKVPKKSMMSSLSSARKEFTSNILNKNKHTRAASEKVQGLKNKIKDKIGMGPGEAIGTMFSGPKKKPGKFKDVGLGFAVKNPITAGAGLLLTHKAFSTVNKFAPKETAFSKK